MKDIKQLLFGTLNFLFFYIVSNIFLLCMSVTWLAIFSSQIEFYAPLKDQNYINEDLDGWLNWTESGCVFGMLGFLVAIGHHFVKNKFLIFGAAGLIALSFILWSIGMFIGTQLNYQDVNYPLAFWFLYTFQCMIGVLNVLQMKQTE